MQLRPYQLEAIEAAEKALAHGEHPVLSLPTGCHAPGQGLLLYDGSEKPVEDIRIGDLLIGPDSQPREVLTLHHGVDDLLEIVPTKGSSWVVNAGHVLTLVRTPQGGSFPSQHGGVIRDVPLSQWLTWTRFGKHIHKLFRVPAHFDVPAHKHLIEPYFLGLLLGDGSCGQTVSITKPDAEIEAEAYRQASLWGLGIRRHLNSSGCPGFFFSGVRGRRNPLMTALRSLGLQGKCAGEKFVPTPYKIASTHDQLEVLAGLLDTDGSLSRAGYDYSSKSYQLASDVAFLARCVGLAAYVAPCEKYCQTGAGGTYFRVSISGDTSRIPCRIARKQAPPRQQKKNVLRTGFSVRPAGRGEYYGFTLSGDGRYLLNDFTVTHNSGKSLVLAEIARRYDGRVLVATHRQELLQQNLKALTSLDELSSAGIYSAGLNRRDAAARIVFGGIASIYRHMDALQQWGPFGLIIVDECHLVAPRSHTKSMYAQVFTACPSALRVGLSATPWRLNDGPVWGTPECWFTTLAYEIGIRELTPEYLVPLRGMLTAHNVDVSGVRTRQGEYVISDLSQKACDVELVDGALDELCVLAANRDHWLLFCVDVAHTHLVRDRLQLRQVSCAAITGETPQDERAAILQAFEQGKIRALVNCLVACLDEETEILTQEGWRDIWTIKETDHVASYDSTLETVTFDLPKAIFKRPRAYDERMVVLQSRTRNVRVTANHRMLYKTWKPGAYKIRDASAMVGKKAWIPVSAHHAPLHMDVQQEEKKKTTPRRLIAITFHYRHKYGLTSEQAREKALQEIARHEALRYKSPHELTRAECQLIGFFLGDGSHHRKSGGGTCLTFSQSFAYPAIIQWFDGVIASAGMDVSRSEYPHRTSPKGGRGSVIWTIPRGTGWGPQQRRGFYALTPYLRKSGSPLYWGLSVEQFSWLLEGLHCADGLHGNEAVLGNSAFISGTNLPLFDLLQGIASCKGWSARIIKMKSTNPDGKKPLYTLSLVHKRQESLAWGRFQWEEAPWRDELVWCVSSTTGNIITRRRGTVTIMGNTTGFNLPDVDAIALLRPSMSKSLIIQMIGRASRKAIDKPDALILDFADNFERHAPLDAIPTFEKSPTREHKDREKQEKLDAARERLLAHKTQASIHDPFEVAAPVTLVREVLRVDYSVEPSRKFPGKQNLVVSYLLNGSPRWARSWVCLEYPGGSKYYASQWFKRRQRPMPATAMEALQCAIRGEYPAPSAVVLAQDGKYMRITLEHFVPTFGELFGTDEESEEDDDAGRD